MDDSTLLQRLRRIEDQLEILSQRVGVPYARPGHSLPPSVRALVLSGKTIQAIQAAAAHRHLAPGGKDRDRERLMAALTKRQLAA